MFNLAYATDLEETYNKIKDIDTGGFAALSSELENHIVHFNNNMVFLFNSANSSWACSTKDSADNSVATIKASLEAIKPSAELVGEVGPLVRSAIDNINDYIEAYQNYIQVKNSKPSETILYVDAKGNQDRKANQAYSDWKNITLPNAYYNASNLENTARASLKNITACLSGQDVSNATISPVSLGEGQFMVAIEETLPDGNVKRGYKVEDADGNVLKEIYNIIDKENNAVVQSSIVTYDKEKNTKSEEYTLYSSNGDTVNGTKNYDQLSRVISDTYTDTNGNKHTLTNQYVSDTTDLSFVEEKIESVIDGKSVITDKTTPYHGGNAGNTEYKVYYKDNPDNNIKTGTIWCDNDQIKHDDYTLYDDGDYIGEGSKFYNSDDALIKETYKSPTQGREGTITYAEDGSKVDEYKQTNSDDGSVDEGTILYDSSGNARENKYEIKYKNLNTKSGTIFFEEDGTKKDEYTSYAAGSNTTKEGTYSYDSAGELVSNEYILNPDSSHEVTIKETYDGNTTTRETTQKIIGDATNTVVSSITYGDDGNSILHKTVTDTTVSADGTTTTVVGSEEGYNEEGRHFITNTDAQGVATTRVQNDDGSYSIVPNETSSEK